MDSKIYKKAERLADLLLRLEMTADEMQTWLAAISKMSKDQIEEMISTFETEIMDLEKLRVQSREELTHIIEADIRAQYQA